jgi:hypothetical protein
MRQSKSISKTLSVDALDSANPSAFGPDSERPRLFAVRRGVHRERAPADRCVIGGRHTNELRDIPYAGTISVHVKM